MKRSHKKMDPEVKALGLVLRGMETASPRMRRATLEFAWDKYVSTPARNAGVAAPHPRI